MVNREITCKYSNAQAFLLVSLRIIIGWYFLYEGIIKITNADWTSLGYLMDSKGFMSGFYTRMALNENIVAVIDFLNKWGLTFIGLGLMMGLFTQLALFFGMLLLTFYFLSHPPLADVTYIMPQEGSYLWVNKTLIEIVTMALLMAFPTGHIFGIDHLISKKSQK